MKTIKLLALTVLVGLFILTSLTVIAQKYYSGYQYIVSIDDFVKFKYSRNYSESVDEFVTTYKIYHPVKGHHIKTITATHYKSEKKIVVKVMNAGGGMFADINTEKTTYKTPSLAPFGIPGPFNLIGGNRVPFKLLVIFVSSKFENVKVVHVYGTAMGGSKHIFYVLDESAAKKYYQNDK